MEYLKSFAVAFFSFLILDGIWLGLIVKDFNMRHLSEIGRFENGVMKVDYLPAALVYVLLAVAVNFFVVSKTSIETPIYFTFLSGALLGLIVYGVYDLTNLAILKNYPVQFALVDMAWGTFVFGVVSVISVKI